MMNIHWIESLNIVWYMSSLPGYHFRIRNNDRTGHFDLNRPKVLFLSSSSPVFPHFQPQNSQILSNVISGSTMGKS